MELVVLQPGPVSATFAAVTVFSHMRPMFHQEQTLLQQDVHTGGWGGRPGPLADQESGVFFQAGKSRNIKVPS